MGITENTVSGGGAAPFDPDAQTYFNNITTNGGTISPTSMTAINNLVLCMKASGTWALQGEIYPYAGNQLAAALTKLKFNTGNSPFLTNHNFVSGDYVETGAAAGLTGDASAKYLQTGYLYNTFTADNTSLSVYCTSQNGSGGQSSMGGYDGDGAIIGLSSDQFSFIGGVTGGPKTPTNTSFGALSRTGGITSVYGPSGLSTSSSDGSAFGTGVEHYVFAFNASGSPIEFSKRTLAFTTLGQNLTGTQITSMYNCIQTFQTALGRQI